MNGIPSITPYGCLWHRIISNWSGKTNVYIVNKWLLQRNPFISIVYERIHIGNWFPTKIDVLPFCSFLVMWKMNVYELFNELRIFSNCISYRFPKTIVVRIILHIFIKSSILNLHRLLILVRLISVIYSINRILITIRRNNPITCRLVVMKNPIWSFQKKPKVIISKAKFIEFHFVFRPSTTNNYSNRSMFSIMAIRWSSDDFSDYSISLIEYFVLFGK